MSRMSDVLDWLGASITGDDLLSEDEDSVFLGPEDVDLVEEYQRLNRVLYDGKLGMYPMRWNNRKRAGAMVLFNRVRNGDKFEIKIVGIEFSKFAAFTINVLRNRMAHEMIHVYWLEKGLSYGHDGHFKSEMRRINNLPLGLNVTLTGETGGPELKYKDSGKKYGVFVFTNRGIAEGVCLVPERSIDDMAWAIWRAFSKYPRYRDARIEIFVYDAGWLSGTFNVRRVPSSKTFPEFQYVKPSELVQIREQGTYHGFVDIEHYERGGKNPYL